MPDFRKRFTFKQDGADLQGSGGRGSGKQLPIVLGSIAGDSVKFELKDRENSFLYNLRLEDTALKGTLSVTIGDNVRVIKVRLEHVR